MKQILTVILIVACLLLIAASSNNYINNSLISKLGSIQASIEKQTTAIRELTKVIKEKK